MNATFQGQSDPYFLGLIPVLNIFDELEGHKRCSDAPVPVAMSLLAARGSLAENSQFINDLRGILLDTQAGAGLCPLLPP